MTPDDADRAITAEIGLWDPRDQASARKMADFLPRTEEGVRVMRALRIDGFAVFDGGTIEVRKAD